MFRSTSVECPDVGRARPRQETLTYEIDVITPLFGGGESPGSNDSVTLIRGSSVRGHLRFWWRATRGANYEDASHLKAAETQLWGGKLGNTMVPSPVGVSVEVLDKESPEPWARYNMGEDGKLKAIPQPINKLHPAYALFPFQGKRSEDGKSVVVEPASAVNRAQFRLTVTLPWRENKQEMEEIRSGVENAIWAWVNFGGIGARTRRGCGALYCENLAISSFEECDKYHNSEVRPWPTFFKTILWKTVDADKDKDEDKVLRAWFNSVRILKLFRQRDRDDGIGRNKGHKANKPGRSRWPEADSLRALADSVMKRKGRKGRHFHSRTLNHELLRADPHNHAGFPRAELGLPIVMKFDDYEKQYNATIGVPVTGDDDSAPNSDGTVRCGRMASAVITRPIKFRDGKVVSALILLQAARPDKVVVVFDEHELMRQSVHTFGSNHIVNKAFVSYQPGLPPSPMENRSEYGSALEALIAYASCSKRGYRRIELSR